MLEGGRVTVPRSRKLLYQDLGSELAGNEEHFYAALPALTWRT